MDPNYNLTNPAIKERYGLREDELSVLRRHAAFPLPMKSTPSPQGRALSNGELIDRWLRGIEKLRAELSAA